MSSSSFGAGGSKAHILVEEYRENNPAGSRGEGGHGVSGRPDTKVPLARLLPTFYRERGWDERGIPTKGTLKMLGLDFTAVALPRASADADGLQREFLDQRFSYETNHALQINARRRFNQKLKTPAIAPAKKAPAAKPAPPRLAVAQPPPVKQPLLKLTLPPRGKAAKKPTPKPAVKPKARAGKKPKKR